MASVNSVSAGGVKEPVLGNRCFLEFSGKDGEACVIEHLPGEDQKPCKLHLTSINPKNLNPGQNEEVRKAFFLAVESVVHTAPKKTLSKEEKDAFVKTIKDELYDGENPKKAPLMCGDLSSILDRVNVYIEDGELDDYVPKEYQEALKAPVSGEDPVKFQPPKAGEGGEDDGTKAAKNFCADLILNGDPRELVSSDGLGGKRIVNVFEKHMDVFRSLLKDVAKLRQDYEEDAFEHLDDVAKNSPFRVLEMFGPTMVKGVFDFVSAALDVIRKADLTPETLSTDSLKNEDGQKIRTALEGVARTQDVEWKIDAALMETFDNMESETVRGSLALDLANALGINVDEELQTAQQKIILTLLHDRFEGMSKSELRKFFSGLVPNSNGESIFATDQMLGMLKFGGVALVKALQGLKVNAHDGIDQTKLDELTHKLPPMSESDLKIRLDRLFKAMREKDSRLVGLTVLDSNMGTASIAQTVKCRLEYKDNETRTVVLKLKKPDVENLSDKELSGLEKAFTSTEVESWNENMGGTTIGSLATALTDTLEKQVETLGKLDDRLDRIGTPGGDPKAKKEELKKERTAVATAVVASEIKLKLAWKLNGEIMGAQAADAPKDLPQTREALIKTIEDELKKSYEEDNANLVARQKEEVNFLKAKQAEELKKLGTQDKKAVERMKKSHAKALDKLEKKTQPEVTKAQNASQEATQKAILAKLKELKEADLVGLMATLNELGFRDSREFLAELAEFGKDEIGALQGELAKFRSEQGDLGKVKAKIDRDRMNNERAHLKGFVSSIREEMKFDNELGNALLGLISYDEELKDGKGANTQTVNFKSKNGLLVEIEREKKCFSVLPALKDGSPAKIAEFKKRLQEVYDDYKKDHAKDFNADDLKKALLEVAKEHCLIVSEDCLLMEAVPNRSLDDMIKDADATIKEKKNDKEALVGMRKKVVLAKKSLLELARVFIDGIFNQDPPFFHCDLHGGNILYDADTGRFTIIDYGKGLVLSKDEQAAFKELFSILASNPQMGSAGLLLDAYQKIVEGEIQRKLDGGAIQGKDVELDNLIRTKERLSELGTNSLRDKLMVEIEKELKDPKDSNADLRHILDAKLTANGKLLDAFRYQLEKANLAIPVAMFDFLDTIEKLVNSESKLDEMIAKLPASDDSKPVDALEQITGFLKEGIPLVQKSVEVSFRSPELAPSEELNLKRTNKNRHRYFEMNDYQADYELGLTKGDDTLTLFNKDTTVTVDLFALKGAEELKTLRSLIDAEMKKETPSKTLLRELMHRYGMALGEFRKTVTREQVGEALNAKFLDLFKDNYLAVNEYNNLHASKSNQLKFLMLVGQLASQSGKELPGGTLPQKMANLLLNAKANAPKLSNTEITNLIDKATQEFETMATTVAQSTAGQNKVSDDYEKQLMDMCQLIVDNYKLQMDGGKLDEMLKSEQRRIEDIEAALDKEIDHGKTDSNSVFPDIATNEDKEIRRICMASEFNPKDPKVVAWFNAVPNEIKVLAKDVAKRNLKIAIDACDDAMTTLDEKISDAGQELGTHKTRTEKRELEASRDSDSDQLKDIKIRKERLLEKFDALQESESLPLTREMCLACVEVKQRIDREEIRPLDNLGAVMSWAMPKDQTKTGLVDNFVDQQNKQSEKSAEFILQHNYEVYESEIKVSRPCHDKLTTSGSETKVEALVRRVKAYYTELAELDGKKPEDIRVMKNPEVQQERAVIIKNQIDAVVAGLREKYEMAGSYPEEADLRMEARKIWIAHCVHACLAENSTREEKGGIHTDYRRGGGVSINRPYELCKCCANDVLNFGAGDAPEDEIFGCYLYLPKEPAEGKQAA